MLIFNLYLKDVDDVKLGVVSSLAKFLAALPLEYRESYLPVLEEILHSSSEHNWRMRHLLAKQLVLISEIFSAPATCSVIVSVVVKMLADSVSVVRDCTCEVRPHQRYSPRSWLNV